VLSSGGGSWGGQAEAEGREPKQVLGKGAVSFSPPARRLRWILLKSEGTMAPGLPPLMLLLLK